MENSPRNNSIGAQMAVLIQLMKSKNQHVIDETGYKITMEQLSIVEALCVQGEMNMTELAHTVLKQNANITRIVDKLEKNKFVKRKSVKGDRRAYKLSVTETGKELCNTLVPIIKKNYIEMTSCLSKENEATTLQVLKDMIKHLS